MARTSEIMSRYERAIYAATKVKQLRTLWRYIEDDYDEEKLTDDEYGYFYKLLNKRINEV